MGCCVLATLFVGGIWDRTAGQIAAMGTGPQARRAQTDARMRALLGRRWRVWLPLIALVEIGVALLVAAVLARTFSGVAAEPTMHAGMTHSGAADNGRDPVVVTWLVVGLVLVLFSAAAARTLLAGGRGLLRPALLVLAADVALVVGYLASRAGRPLETHALWMVLLMLAAVSAPCVIGAVFAVTRPGAPLAASVVRVGAPGTALALVSVVYAWHLPVAHDWLMSGDVALPLLVAFAVASTFWGTLLSDGRPELAGVRIVSLLVVGGASGFLGLALLLGQGDLMSGGAPAAPWGAAIDQRLAGLLMMVADAAAVVPLLGRLITSLPRPSGRARVARTVRHRPIPDKEVHAR